jgi:hypothetical protein
MRCLIDADILLHEISFHGQFKDKETGEDVLLPFEPVSEMLDQKINSIKDECMADDEPILFITSSDWIVNCWNNWAKYNDRELMEHVPNFRYEVAVSKPYKGTRKNPKPFHFQNLVSYMISNYNVVISKDGLEADDEACIAQREAQSKGEETVICSRDKDLRICQGWHYSWECGEQKAIGPHYTDPLGSLELTIKEVVRGGKVVKEKKVTGYGLSFFLCQMFVGDSADNIPGLPRHGVAVAWDLLSPLLGDKEAMIKVVKDAYKEKMGDQAREYFLEQARLLWMQQRRDDPFDIRKLK